MEMIIDATDQIVGRLASLAAKSAMKGDSIHVINSEKAVISGNPEYTIKTFKERLERGDPYHGPFYPRHPDRILKRVIRGMLPYKKHTGKLALNRVKVYISTPEELSGKETIQFKRAENKLYHNHMTLGDLSVKLGATRVW